MLEHCNVLVIGGGAAALRAACAAAEQDASLDILLVTKGRLGESGVTATAFSDRMTFHATLPQTEPGGSDAWRLHAEDIYRLGGYVSDGDLAEILAQGSGGAFRYLERLGVPWVRRADGLIDQFVTDGSAYARGCYTGPDTARQMELALLRQLAKTRVRVRENCMVIQLATNGDLGAVTGAWLLDESSTALEYVACGAVILATGGAGQVYGVNVYPPDCSGDGYALAYHAGAELVNMEFIQFGLCSVATKLACSGSMMRALPRLMNDTGDDLLARYLSGLAPAERLQLLYAKGASWPVSSEHPTARIDIAVTRERVAGRRVYLDYAHDPAGIAGGFDSPAWQATLGAMRGAETDAWQSANSPLERLRHINAPVIGWLRERGIDLERGDQLEIAPAAQHFQGGVRINAQAETSLPGLYTAGEAAGAQHGANRPGGNALLDTQVFGEIAGEQAARYCRNHPASADIMPLPPEYADGILSPLVVLTELPKLMDRNCAVVRSEAGLREALAQVVAWRNQGIRMDKDGMNTAWRARSLLTVAELVLTAALARDESRGPHLRFGADDPDNPLPGDQQRWRRYLVLDKAGDEVRVRSVAPRTLTR
ncbi:MAG: FAD-binding protein [Chloroflexi bacterium]|nr:FAD-binding protein [Chloroflexota bacterium]